MTEPPTPSSGSADVTRPPRLLYLPNETAVGDQVGHRAAFEAMKSDGRLSDYLAFSFLVELEKEKSPQRVLKNLLEIANGFSPDIILWQHIGSFPVTKTFLRSLKETGSRPTLAYHEADVYGWIRKRIPKSVRVMAGEADLVFLCGLGPFANLFRWYGARNIRYAPHSVDTIRFGTPWEPTRSRTYDAILIGNLVTSRIPFLRIPGARSRERLVREMTKTFGNRFAVYGRGWEGISSWKGVVPYPEQEKAIRESWISVSWDHFDNVPCYFSDRLPISLLSGVAHVTNFQPGYDALFPDGTGLLYSDTTDGIVDITRRCLGLGSDYLIQAGRQGRLFCLEHLLSDIVSREMVQECNKHRISSVKL